MYQQPPSYDVTPDGRFVTIRADEESPVSVIVNWPEPPSSSGMARSARTPPQKRNVYCSFVASLESCLLKS